MPRTIHFRVEGETERFLEELKSMGLSERDAFAKALGLLNLVHKTNRVALLRTDGAFVQSADQVVELVFTMQELKPADSNRPSDFSAPVAGPGTPVPSY